MRSILKAGWFAGFYLISSAAMAAPCAGFQDVSDADVDLCAAVTFIKNKFITLGCQSTPTLLYCPSNDVRRDQMALFLSRLGNQSFLLGGNAFGSPGILGTNDDHPLDLRVNGQTGLRLQKGTITPSVIGGNVTNSVTATEGGGAVGGGGFAAMVCGPAQNQTCANRVLSAFGTVSGGLGNTAASYSTVAGGTQNSALGSFATVMGGEKNSATGTASVAAGTFAMAETSAGFPLQGAFVFSDFLEVPFHGTNTHEFSARFRGGFRFVTNVDGLGAPTRTVGINQNAEMTFGTDVRQMLNLWGTAYGIGVQSGAVYFRTDSVPVDDRGFAWYNGGVHANANGDAGGGTELMRLHRNGNLHIAGTLNPSSDRALKTAFVDIDPSEVLAKVVGMPVTGWAYKHDPDTRHVGPVAQDFRSAFGLGRDDASIATVDADGIALAAIKGLNAKVEAGNRTKEALIVAQSELIAGQAREIEALRKKSAAAVDVLAERLADLEKRMAETKAAASTSGYPR